MFGYLRVLLSASVVLGLASAAVAGPTITYTSTPLGGGLTAYDFTIHSNDAQNNALAETITFSSAPGINQVLFNGSKVDTSTNATTFDGILSYSKATDSWFYDPFASNGIAFAPNYNTSGNGTGIGQTSTTYGINGTSGNNSHVTDALFAHIVSTGAVSWAGDIFRSDPANQSNNIDYPVSGSTAVPEPASLAVLSMGAVGLMARARRRRA